MKLPQNYAAGAFSSGIFAYGLSLFYGLTASTNLQIISQRLAQRVEQNGGHPDAILIVAMLTTATGLLFKVAAVPFHQWAPDAYEGAPTSITGFMRSRSRPRAGRCCSAFS
jgi:NADH-quinone oxidoreductase subunit N